MNRLQVIAACGAIAVLHSVVVDADWEREQQDAAADVGEARAALAVRAAEKACGDRANVITTARGTRCVETASDGTLVAVRQAGAR